MRCESWMNRTPVPTRTPFQLAEADVRHWSARQKSLIEELANSDRELTEAIERLERASR